MQSVCVLLPSEPFRAVIDLRAALCEDPLLGAIYDPPFAHFTLQLAEEYDWDGLSTALATFAKDTAPFPATTVGLLVFTGSGTAIAVAPVKNAPLTAFHAAVWETITPFAQGRVDPFYHPDRWVPHVTIKRSGPHTASFAQAMARLSTESFAWQMTVDNVSVQQDPGKNSLTHYLRLRSQLGGDAAAPLAVSPGVSMNATISDLRQETSSDGTPTWRARIKRDDGPEVEQQWSAARVVQLSAGVMCSPAHFPGGRCNLDGEDSIVAIAPNTPFPMA